MKENITSIVLSWTFIIFGTIVSYMILLKLTNHSPTLEQINISLTVGIGVLVLKIYERLGKFSEFYNNSKENINDVKNSISRVNTRLDRIDDKFDMFEHQLLNIEKRLMLIEQKI